jgi:hypothetical protein
MKDLSEIQRKRKEMELRAWKMYFKKYGENAPTPSNKIQWIIFNGKTYLVLFNEGGILAMYRVYSHNKIREIAVVRV